MTLEQIETYVLLNIRHSRYSKLSAAAVTTNDGKDFLMLHRVVTFARQELQLNAYIPSFQKRETIATVANTKTYTISANDFDLPRKLRYRTSAQEFELEQVYPDNLLKKLGGIKTTSVGTPDFYMMFGSSGDKPVIELYKIPDKAAEFDIEYLPVLAEKTTSTDETVDMKKYGLTIVKLASAYAFQLIKNDSAKFAEWLTVGAADYAKINQREMAADSNYKEIPDSLIRARRASRFSK